MKPVVSIIILTKNAGESFEELMKRIEDQSYQDFEVLVIDSGSEDRTLKIAKNMVAGCIT